MELWSPFSWLKQQFLSSEEHDSWGRSSSFTTWNIYSQFFLGASLLSLSTLVVLAVCRHQPYQQEVIGRGRGRRVVPPLCPTPCLSLYPWLQLVRDMVLVCVLVSVPWEWIRLYQIEVAKKMAVLSEAVTSAASRVVVQPLELVAQGFGRSLRLIMQEIPSLWQPFFFPILLLCFLCGLLSYIFRQGAGGCTQTPEPSPRKALCWR
ncbi:hypothetical protein AOXY_G23852 [Acipenser oxyrinchus oxyrinchus]|uniref:Chloride channel CLIC-like protein 1 n=1 Tax=Acipenser oxyrinchus oxyrinchus TaxID=40147 RepID=A0AAD8CTR9_ACIOX|nr:hypothetical protein AOXY_G23852 [Acipenser oxyrinchus oxyrinchus]